MCREWLFGQLYEFVVVTSTGIRNTFVSSYYRIGWKHRCCLTYTLLADITRYLIANGAMIFRQEVWSRSDPRGLFANSEVLVMWSQ